MRNLDDLNISEAEIKSIIEAFPKGAVFFDMEMTGLSPLLDKIIEIGAIKIEGNGDTKVFHKLVNPLIPITGENSAIHGITNETVKDCPSLKPTIKEFSSFYENLPLIAHNAKFDTGFLIRGLHQYNQTISLSDIYDSCKMARILFKKETSKPENFKLNTLANFYELKFHHHRAIDDTLMCLKVFSRLLHEKNKKNLNLKDVAFLYKLNSFQKASNYEITAKFKLLEESIKNKKVVEIVYKGGSTGDTPRPIRPISLLPMPSGPVLYAECLISNFNKSFLLKKIKKITKLES